MSEPPASRSEGEREAAEAEEHGGAAGIRDRGCCPRAKLSEPRVDGCGRQKGTGLPSERDDKVDDESAIGKSD